MNIVLGSAFRNAAGAQISRWAQQCKSLQDSLSSDITRWILGTEQYEDASFRMIAVEGDSSDNTRGELEYLQLAQREPLTIISCNHGQRVFGSTEEEDRLAALSQVGNAILSGVEKSDDILIYVESDLIWDAYTMVCLIDKLLSGNYDVIAPLIFAGNNFYDIFVYRGLDGERFSPFPPYHRDLPREGETQVLTEVSSAGSCLVMKAEVARRCRIRNNQALLGFCEDVREKGYHIWVDSTQRIYHP